MSNLNVVAVWAVVASTPTSLGFFTTRENGIVFCVGIPFSTVTTLSSIGRLESSAWKKISIEDKKIPVGSLPIMNVCATGSRLTTRLETSLSRTSPTRVLSRTNSRVDKIVRSLVSRRPLAWYVDSAEESSSIRLFTELSVIRICLEPVRNRSVSLLGITTQPLTSPAALLTIRPSALNPVVCPSNLSTSVFPAVATPPPNCSNVWSSSAYDVIFTSSIYK